ncbi:helix-turn-helix domain-containing protein [Pedobacter nyackensis]|uniref:helix-turn-helix domain-containing protein n=1 Tax=Pedobacter nyackensis TaxID=475255 RepID=UPI0039776A77
MNISTTEFKIKLGYRIKTLRIRANLTQQELATKMGFKDKQVINRYEIEGSNPMAYSLLQLSSGSGGGVSKSFLFFLNFFKS